MSKYLQLIAHPSELRSVIQWAVWHEPVYPRDISKETDNLKRCYELLGYTSRSFAAVIQELSPELREAVMLFYLILRALDTIEDDMTIHNTKKLPLLRAFYLKLTEEGWTFHDSKEKDRVVLEEFDKIIYEFSLLKPIYKEIITDITKEMGKGMASYCEDDDFNKKGVNTVKEYDLYCHYVAGIVGEGLTRLAVAGKAADPRLLEAPHLHESMGLFLQKTNIIRDYHEDLLDTRKFWPKEIWSNYASTMEDFVKPENEQAGLYCLSELVANAIEHIPDCLYYLAGIKEQSVFNFCAIPQVMAVATLELVFQNKKVLTGHVKLRKGTACSLMLRSTSIRSTYDVFQEYTHKIAQRNKPDDPNYMRISIACAKVDQFIENIFPSPRSENQVTKEEPVNKPTVPDEPLTKDTFIVLALFGFTMLFTSSIMFGVAWYFGARFDLAFKSIWEGHFASKAIKTSAEAVVGTAATVRDEL
ncbi:isoprenoid synthase domain-containing protein [Lipomyces japonicus]|uniref:isoprenoid synthase domain-containing protein n=1 Tax=Lipomyces japonicus TaxID=56871 RepID=UPI0034D00CF5